MPTHTATIRTINRNPTHRLVTLNYRQVAQLGFWIIAENK
jgi:hypothetical protein